MLILRLTTVSAYVGTDGCALPWIIQKAGSQKNQVKDSVNIETIGYFVVHTFTPEQVSQSINH